MVARVVPRLAGVVAVCAMALTACAQPPVPSDRYYRLDPGPPARTFQRPALDGVLEVQRFVADGLTAGRPIVYARADAPYELQAYHYQFWTEPPTTMLQDRLATYLRNAGAAGTVVTPEMRVQPDFVLTGRIRRLERVVGEAPKVVLDLELGIKASADDRVVTLGSYRIERPHGEDSVPAAVRAMNAALAEAFANFLDDLATR
jgi:ABC-type uncharacterized transport system auxiliary subunit